MYARSEHCARTHFNTSLSIVGYPLHKHMCFAVFLIWLFHTLKYQRFRTDHSLICLNIPMGQHSMAPHVFLLLSYWMGDILSIYDYTSSTCLEGLSRESGRWDSSKTSSSMPSSMGFITDELLEAGDFSTREDTVGQMSGPVQMPRTRRW